MCGVCGILGPFAAHGDAPGVVREMTRVLAHRGPDGEGFASGPEFFFGHRRLAVIDLETGAQPMVGANGAVTLIFNGEIYNYIELRRELESSGARFSTTSDTEVLLLLYERHGAECVHRLKGMFAFAVFDRRENLFFAARDHFGIKPFYYAMLPDGGLVFASEIKALMCHPDVVPELDKDALNQYLTLQFCLGPRTLFRGVRKLEPGHTLTWKGPGSARTHRYWEVDYTIDEEHDEAYFRDELLSLLRSSVRRQLRSDVPVGGYLSGGMDSSAVVCLAMEKHSNGFACFTGRFNEGPAYDESFYAQAVTKAKGCAYHEITATARDFVETLPLCLYHMDEPAAGPGLFPQYLVSRLASEHVTVVLGGQGGDELFGGYARYLVAYLEQCLKGAVFETGEEGRHIVTMESLIPNLSLLKQYVPLLTHFWRDGLFEPMDARYFRLVDRSPTLGRFMSPDVMAAYDREAVAAEFSAEFNRPDTFSYFNKMTRFDQQTLLPALLQVEDRMSMAASLESRVPLLDPAVAQLLASMPPGMKFKGGRTKHILREAVAPLVPKAVMDRKDKMGFPVPLSEWWSGPLREFVGDTLLSPACRERGLFEPRGLESLIRTEGRFDRQIWGALCLELWHRIFLDGQGV